MAREIYLPSSRALGSRKLSTEEVNEINKKFFKGYQEFRDKPQLQVLLDEIDTYMRELKSYNVEDRQVKNLTVNFPTILGNFLSIIPKFIITLLFVRTISI